MASHLRMLFTVIEDISEVIIDGDGPFCSLPDFLDAFILEHLDEVLLNFVLEHLRLLFFRCVNDVKSLDRHLNFIGLEELLPALWLGKIEVHEDGVVGPLDVHPHILAADDGVYLDEGADRVLKADVQMATLADGNAPERVPFRLQFEVVALGGQRVPKLEAAGRIILLANHEDHRAVGHASAKADI